MSAPKIDDLTVAMPVVILPIERRPKKVLFVVSILLTITLFLAFMSSVVLGFFLGGQIVEESMPAKESEMGGAASIINLLYFLALIIIVTIGILMLVRYKKFGFLKVFMIVTMVLMIFWFTQLMAILYQAYILIILYDSGIHGVVVWVPLIEPISWIAVGVFSLAYIVSVAKLKYLNTRNIVLILNTIWAAVWLSWTSGVLTPIVILIGMALYDLYLSLIHI